MNGKELLVALGYVGEELYEEAASTSGYVAAKKVFSRPVLIAALIVLTLLLVGCSVLCVLRLQDLSIGREFYTQHYDESGKEIDPVEKTKDILTLSAQGSEKLQKAQTEWYEFLKTYDPEGKLSANVSDIPEVLNRYEYIYDCYTTDMVSKLNEITEKYGLKLLEEALSFQQYQSHIFLEETGIGSLLWEYSGAEISSMAGMLYLPGNFWMEFELAAEDIQPLYVDFSYSAKEYMPRAALGGGLDLSNYDQWDHIASDGTRLLLALSRSGHGLILAGQEKANIVISVSGNRSTSLYPKEEEVISKTELEIIADVFDYTVQPGMVDAAVLKERLAESESIYLAEHSYVPETYEGFTQYLKEKIWIPDEALLYTFYDLTGDGEEELLIGKNGAYTEWITLQDGKTQTQLVQETYLCEGGVEERYTAYEIYETHMYLAPLSKSAVDDIGAERSILLYLRRENELWIQSSQQFSADQKKITEEQAQSVMARYPRIELNWNKLMDYPLDEQGMTLRSYLEEKNTPLNDGELVRCYREWMEANLEEWHTHYRLMDINADGVDDLLLSGDGDHYWQAVTHSHGRIVSLVEEEFYLCENGFLEIISTRWNGQAEMTGSEFIRLTEFGREVLNLLVYNKAKVSWQDDWYESTITKEQAERILNTYPRLDQSMRPIDDLRK